MNDMSEQNDKEEHRFLDAKGNGWVNKLIKAFDYLHTKANAVASADKDHHLVHYDPGLPWDHTYRPGDVQIKQKNCVDETDLHHILSSSTQFPFPLDGLSSICMSRMPGWLGRLLSPSPTGCCGVV